METKRPVAYICHTSEDKGSFVLPFAKKLSENGIKVSVDSWELSHGESLIEKIFTEGIKSADAFIIVISEFSVRKTWITEEMRPGLVKRITAHSKLIPIVIDDCEIPESLRDVPLVTIRDVNTGDREIKKIAESLYGGAVPTTPEMPAKAAEETVRMIPGLTKDEMQILKTSCEYSVEKDRRFVNTSDITAELTAKESISASSISICSISTNRDTSRPDGCLAARTSSSSTPPPRDTKPTPRRTWTISMSW